MSDSLEKETIIPENEEKEQISPQKEEVTQVSETMSPAEETEEKNLSSDDNELRDAIASFGIEFSSYKDRFVEMAKKVERHANEMNKLYHNEFSGRLQKMQAEIEEYRERDKDRIYDGILIELASLYSRDNDIIRFAENEVLKKRLTLLFEDMLSLLNKYHVVKIESQPGDKRNIRHCDPVQLVPTECKEKHDTVVRSLGAGFYTGNRTLVKEKVDIYVYKENIDDNSSNNQRS